MKLNNQDIVYTDNIDDNNFFVKLDELFTDMNEFVKQWYDYSQIYRSGLGMAIEMNSRSDLKFTYKIVKTTSAKRRMFNVNINEFKQQRAFIIQLEFYNRIIDDGLDADGNKFKKDNTAYHSNMIRNLVDGFFNASLNSYGFEFLYFESEDWIYIEQNPNQQNPYEKWMMQLAIIYTETIKKELKPATIGDIKIEVINK